MIIGIAAAAVVGVLVLALVAGALLFRAYGNQQPRSWPERAAAIPGIHNDLASNPEWFAVGPQGNHRRGLITYPVSPPVGGLHNGPISLQGWGYQLKLDNASDKRTDDFIGALRINASVEPGASCSGGITDTGTLAVIQTV